MQKFTVIAFSFLTLAFSALSFYSEFFTANESFVLTISKDIPVILSVDKYSSFFIFLITILWPLAAVYSFAYLESTTQNKDHTQFHVFFTLAILSAIIFSLSNNLISAFIFYEILTLATTPLVGYNKTKESRHSATVYIMLLLTLSFTLLLPSILFIKHKFHTVSFFSGGFFDSSLIDEKSATILFALMVLSIGKSAMIPFHFWLPKAMSAPAPVSGLLHAVAVVKVGAFFIFRIVNDVFGIDFLVENLLYNPLMIFAIITIVISASRAIVQKNIKTLLAYSTISHISYILLAFSLFSNFGMLAGMVEIACHAISKITLFLSIGAFYISTRSYKIARLKGIGVQNKFLGLCFAFSCLSLAGAPFTVGFVGKMMLLSASISSHNFIALLIFALATILNFAYIVPIILVIFKHNGQPEDPLLSSAAPRAGVASAAHVPTPIPVLINFIVAFLVLLNIGLFVIASIFGLNELSGFRANDASAKLSQQRFTLEG